MAALLRAGRACPRRVESSHRGGAGRPVPTPVVPLGAAYPVTNGRNDGSWRASVVVARAGGEVVLLVPEGTGQALSPGGTAVRACPRSPGTPRPRPGTCTP